MKLSAIIQTIERFAPVRLAMDWDNVGLLAGDPDSDISAAVLCLDITEQAYEQCISSHAELCICHHPFIFNPIRRIDFSHPQQRVLSKMLQSGIAIYAAHTNLDVCDGGVNDALAAAVGLTVVQPSPGRLFPAAADDFASTNSIKGEGPAIWRICSPGEHGSLFGLYKDITEKLKVPGCHVNFDTDRPVGRILVLGGSYDSEWNDEAVRSGADVIICGEMKHRDMVYFAYCGIAVIAAGHDASERVVLPVLAEYLRAEYPEIVFAVWEGFDYNRIVF